MNPLHLSIFFFTEETHSLEKVGITTSLEMNELREMTFYNVDCIAPHIDGDKEYCAIHSGGKEFICNLSYVEVNKRINFQLLR